MKKYSTICADCGDTCLVDIDDGEEVSQCCGASLAEGGKKKLRQVIRIARKDHVETFTGRAIPKGTKYIETVVRLYRRGGPSWIAVGKHIIPKL